CFEDDMRLLTEPGLCRNGFSAFMPRLLSRALEILRNEPALDFLMLSFTGLDDECHERQPSDDVSPNVWRPHLPGRDAARACTIKSHGGVSYIVGGVAWAHAPALMTRRAAERMVLRVGRLDGGVLLASPVNHACQLRCPIP